MKGLFVTTPPSDRRYDHTPIHYHTPGGDVYDVFIAHYGLDTWQRHVEMEAVQYILRARRKGQYAEDITKAIVILQRILAERARQVCP